MSNNTKQLLSKLLFITLIALTPLLFIQVNAHATPLVQKSLSVVIMGDSYSAGTGAGMYYGPSGSYRSHRNWGSIYANWLKAQGVRTQYTNIAYNGYKTQQVKDYQIDQVPENTNLVLMTIGGNDAEFGNVVQQCFARGLSSAQGCSSSVRHATSALDSIIDSTRDVFEKLESRLSSSSQIVLVGYPLLSIESDDTVTSCSEYKDRKCLSRTTYKTAENVRKLGKLANQKQAEFIKNWNNSHKLKAIFVADIGTTFSGHEPDPSPDRRNNFRWLNEFFETEGREENGTTHSKVSSDKSEWYHPNITGHQKIAERIIKTVGIPSSAKTVTPDNSDIDIAFVIDTTGSMEDTIFSVKQHVKDIMHQIRQRTGSARFALVDYRDHPGYDGASIDYPAQVKMPFTYNFIQFEISVNALNLGDGGDIPETVYSGAMTALDLDWRPGVRKILIIIGDAPAKDPEPVTGYTWQQVAQRAYDIDPVEIYALDMYGGLQNESIQSLTDQSGGKIFPSDSANIASVIIDTIELSSNKPFGWIQGPYVIKVGDSLELDAGGSYAVDNNITAIDWDLDGDGVFETPSDSLYYTHTFTKEFSGTIGVRITDGSGRTGVGSTQLDVTDDGDSTPRHLDNCPDIENYNQSDYDGDGIGDACDDTPGYPTEDMEGVEHFPDGISEDYDAPTTAGDEMPQIFANGNGVRTDTYSQPYDDNDSTSTKENSSNTKTNSSPQRSFQEKATSAPLQLAIFITAGVIIVTTVGYVAWQRITKQP